MVSRPEHPRLAVHAFVECRARGGRWWLYARPALSLDDRIAATLAGEAVDTADATVNALGVPQDVSPAVLDEYTWRIAGSGAWDSGNVVGAREAAAWLARGLSRPWPTTEPFARVSDPRWEHATWMSRSDLDTALSLYESVSGQLAPATFCALRAMMRELERDYLVRVVFWFERLPRLLEQSAPESGSLRDHHGELDRVRGRLGDTAPPESRRTHRP